MTRVLVIDRCSGKSVAAALIQALARHSEFLTKIKEPEIAFVAYDEAVNPRAYRSKSDRKRGKRDRWR